MIRNIQFCACIVSAFVISHVSADVTDFAFVKVADYQQVSVAQPTTPFVFSFSAFLSALPDDASIVDINGAALFELDPGEWDHESTFGSKAALDAAFPSTDSYTFLLSGGNLGTRMETLQLEVPETYPSIPDRRQFQ